MAQSRTPANSNFPLVDRLDKSRFEDAVGVLCDAFREYPAMTYTLKDTGSEYDWVLRELIGYLVDHRFSRNWPVLGVQDHDELAAVALVNPPLGGPVIPSLQPHFERWRDGAGKPVFGRFLEFAKATEPFEPDEPFYFLSLIGVPRRYQGRGYARLLLDALHGMSRDDPESAGVVLTTETADNVRLYEHFGYRVSGRAMVGDVPSWLLYRADSP